MFLVNESNTSNVLFVQSVVHQGHTRRERLFEYGEYVEEDLVDCVNILITSPWISI